MRSELNQSRHSVVRRGAAAFIAVIVCLTATPPASAQPKKKPARAKNVAAKPQPTREIVYKKAKGKNGADVELKLHVFEPMGHRPSDRRPAIVFFFGGGWVGGSPGQFYPHCAYLADRRMVAIAAEYRVAKKHGTSPFECVADGKSAIRWVRAHADELGVDPNRIVAGGGSAGGHVAACTALIENFDEPDEDAGVDSRPIGLVLFNPVIDTGPKGYGHSRLKDRYREISPVDHVRPGIPLALVFHGDADTTVPIENVRRFRDRMTRAGNRCELIEFEGEKHGFFNFGRGDGSAYEQTVRRMDAFLVTLGCLPADDLPIRRNRRNRRTDPDVLPPEK